MKTQIIHNDDERYIVEITSKGGDTISIHGDNEGMLICGQYISPDEAEEFLRHIMIAVDKTIK